MSSPRALLRTIRDELQQIFLERGDLIDGALIALLAGQHVLVVGPPGTAKSMLADEVCRRVTGAQYFQWLLTRFTTPEELFGAVRRRAPASSIAPGARHRFPPAARSRSKKRSNGSEQPRRSASGKRPSRRRRPRVTAPTSAVWIARGISRFARS